MALRPSAIPHSKSSNGVQCGEPLTIRDRWMPADDIWRVCGRGRFDAQGAFVIHKNIQGNVVRGAEHVGVRYARSGQASATYGLGICGGDAKPQTLDDYSVCKNRMCCRRLFLS